MAVSRKTVGVMTTAMLAVVGIGLIGATIDSTYASPIPGSDGPGSAPNGDIGGGQNGDSDEDPDQQAPGGGSEGGQSPLEIPEICVPFLTTLPGILLLVGGVVLMAGLAFKRSGLVGGAFVGYLFGLPAVLGYGLVTQCGGTPGNPGGSQSPLQEVVSQLPVTGSPVATPVPPIVLLGFLGLVAVVAVVGLFSATGNEDIETPMDEEEQDDETDLEEFAATAGEAADRIESKDASVDNAVYRAWQEMTELLDIPDPDASTAGMFADAAIEAGLNADDVNQLTRLFEEVRYGDMDPEPREDLALETLRGIEAQYGDPGGSPDGNSDRADGAGGDES